MIKKIILGIFNFIFRLSLAALVVVFVYRLAMYSYHFGYMVFADAAMEPAPGRDIVLTLDNTEDVMDVGRILKARGLVSDEKIFFAQERLSDYHGKMMPGTYTLNTSMKVDDMLAILAESYRDESTDLEGNPIEDPEDEEQTPDWNSYNSVDWSSDGQIREGTDAAGSSETEEIQEPAEGDEQSGEPETEDTQQSGHLGAGAGL